MPNDDLEKRIKELEGLREHFLEQRIRELEGTREPELEKRIRDLECLRDQLVGMSKPARWAIRFLVSVIGIGALDWLAKLFHWLSIQGGASRPH